MNAEDIKKRERLGSMFLYLAALLWGSTFMFQKLLLAANVMPFYMVGIRFSFVLVTLTSLKWTRISRPTWKRGMIMGLVLFCAFAAQTHGLKTLDSSISAFITSMLLVFVPILSHFIDRSGLHPLNILAILLALSGAYFFNLNENARFVWNIGTLLTLGCAIAYAVHMILTSRFVRLSEPLELNAVQSITCAVLGYLMAWISAEPLPLRWNALSLGAMLYLGLIGSILGYSLQSMGQKLMKSVVKASLILSLEPIFAVIIGAPLLGERIGWIQVTGMVLIFSAVLLSEWQSAKESRNGLQISAK